VTPNKYDAKFHLAGNRGWTLMRHRPGLLVPDTFAALRSLVETLEAKS
jgi:hypothetical protein